MRKERLIPFFKWAVYYLLLLLFYTLQTTPKFLSFFGIKPVLIIAFTICVCMFEDIVPSTLFAMIAGLLWDISSYKLMGFNGLIIMACGLFVSLISFYYLHTKILNALMFCSVTLVVQGFLEYFFYYGIWQYDNVHLILTTQILPTMLYTIITTIPMFFLAKIVAMRFSYHIRD